MNFKRFLSLSLILIMLLSLFSFTGCDDILASLEDGELDLPLGDRVESDENEGVKVPSATLDTIPEYDGTSAFVIINDNTPFFEEDDYTTEAYELYSDLDSLGRCGAAMACVGKEIMPTEDRESISSVTPSGWEQNKYDSELVDGGWLYNRAHLIGFQLTGENANKKNLITGTRYFNVEGMLPFENDVADYVRETNNHVLYRVTPIFEGDNLLASGVLIEAYSVEDNGEDICFNVYVYNVQPGIEIDYATGENKLAK